MILDLLTSKVYSVVPRMLLSYTVMRICLFREKRFDFNKTLVAYFFRSITMGSGNRCYDCNNPTQLRTS